jgi:hypothetical protein
MDRPSIFASAFARILIRYAVGPFVALVFAGSPVVAELIADPDLHFLVEVGLQTLGVTLGGVLVAKTEMSRIKAKREGGDL